jgi:hypothetical protein
MAISDIVDPVVAEADQRVERARASLRSRLELLERKFVDVRDQLDVPEHIRRHPWPAVGIALALGALAGRGGRRVATEIGAPTERSLSGTALTLLAGLGLRVVRELAIAQLGLTARRWLEHNGAWADETDARVSVADRSRAP